MKLGLIGAGLWGRKILSELLGLGVEVVVVEQCAERRSACSGASAAFASIEEAGGVDGWIVATPASTHRDVVESLDASGNESPIFCEKPLAATAVDARWFMGREQAEVYVMHIWTFHPAIRKMKELYQEGRIGELNMIRSNRMNWTSPRQDVDSLFNLAPHDLSIFQFFLGELSTPVHASGEWIDGRLVGCLAELRSESNARCVFEVSNRYAKKIRELRLHGSKGVLVLPNDTGDPIQLLTGSGVLDADEVETFGFDSTSALRAELAEFIRFIHTGDDSELPRCDSGANVVFMLDQIKGLLQSQL